MFLLGFPTLFTYLEHASSSPPRHFPHAHGSLVVRAWRPPAGAAASGSCSRPCGWRRTPGCRRRGLARLLLTVGLDLPFTFRRNKPFLSPSFLPFTSDCCCFPLEPPRGETRFPSRSSQQGFGHTRVRKAPGWRQEPKNGGSFLVELP